MAHSEGIGYMQFMTTTAVNPIGSFLKARRAKIDPSTCGFEASRRRTPGLRREEVAQRANISAKWYTFLEQGRGGAPSIDVAHRLSHALDLSAAERDHLLHLIQPRPSAPVDSMGERVSPTLRRMLDAMEFIPAFVKTAAWDIIAWNRAATVALNDYGALPPVQRNLLRLLFAGPHVRTAVSDWETHARFAVAAFRLETGRMGSNETALALVEELSLASPEFAAMWADNEVSAHGIGIKNIKHPIAGLLRFEYSTFTVDGQSDLGLVVFTPAADADLDRVRSLVNSNEAP